MIPIDLLYTEQHEWIRVNGDDATMGITDYAQNSLGDVTFVELPAIGKNIIQDEEVCAVESTKAASSVYAPASGKVTEVNSDLETQPELINTDPYGKGWICKFKLADCQELGKLMSPEKYKTLAEK